MFPVNAPFPTAWSLPFQLAAGIHSSILMSESPDGFNVAATRQNAGRLLAGSFWPPRPPRASGCVNPPAGTDCASVIVAPGGAMELRLSHDPAATTGLTDNQLTTKDTRDTKPNTFKTRLMRRFMASLLC